jgi:phosphonate transport system substrate-binding protein
VRLLLLFIPFILFSDVIRFSPQPVDKSINLYKQYQPMLDYLEEKTGLKFKFVYSATYDELIDNFIKNKVDMIEIGSLPYIRLQEKVKNSKPLVTFLNKNSKPYYTCQLITSDDNIKSVKDINSNTKILLTNKLATCGYLMSQYILKQNGKSLDDYEYKYIGTHIDVVFNTTLKNNLIGGVKSKVADNYHHFIHVIGDSILIPEFSLVVNTNNVEPSQENKIINAITSLKPLENKVDYNLMFNWSNNIKYGAIKTPKNIYKDVQKVLKDIKVKND